MTNGLMDLQRVLCLVHDKIAPNAVNEMWVKTGRCEQESNVYLFSSLFPVIVLVVDHVRLFVDGFHVC